MGKPSKEQKLGKRVTSSSRNSRQQKFGSQIEIEELALVSAIREVEEQVKRLNRNNPLRVADAGVEAERESYAAKTNYYRERLKLVRESMDRLRSGRFGVCASCEGQISDKRLAAVPTAIYCLECQQEIERDRASERPHF